MAQRQLQDSAHVCSEVAELVKQEVPGVQAYIEGANVVLRRMDGGEERRATLVSRDSRIEGIMLHPKDLHDARQARIQAALENGASDIAKMLVSHFDPTPVFRRFE